jgi:hypothetical protein
MAAGVLHIGWYNLCCVHETPRVTPAMTLGVTDHICTITELVEAALAAPTLPAAYAGYTDYKSAA